MHLLASSNGQGGNAQHGSSGGQDVLVKSSSDVKVYALRPYHFIMQFIGSITVMP